MTKTIRVYIAGREYSLRGENEDLLRKVAHEVDSELKSLEEKHKKETASTLSILAALNIAESRQKSLLKKEIDDKFVISELKSMTQYLLENI